DEDGVPPADRSCLKNHENDLRTAGSEQTVRRNSTSRQVQTFIHAFILLRTQIVRQGRRTIYRILGWNRWLHVFFHCWDQIRMPLRC
ncbi:MAG: hypothetical protein V3T64_12940, partial [Myxococcota bacterium]